MEDIVIILLFAWGVLYWIQIALGYGTAYRLAKTHGDNGVSLFGWALLVAALASYIPGLGIYLWYKYREDPMPMREWGKGSASQQAASASARPCPSCGKPLPPDGRFCEYCGERFDVIAPASTEASPDKGDGSANTASAPAENAQLRCPSCGSVLPEDSVFCENCGAKISSQADSSGAASSTLA